MFDDVEYRPAVGDLAYHEEVRMPVKIVAMYRGPVEYSAVEVAGTRFTTLTSKLSPAYA